MNLLRLHDIKLSIGKQLICQDLSLTLTAGQVWAILGRNGAGKSTLLHTLAGLRHADHGTIFFKEHSFQHYSRQYLAQNIGILLQQQIDAFPSTVLETVLTGRYPHLTRWQRLQEEDLQLAQTILQDLDLLALRTRSLNTLSGGERQRVALAAVLAQTPQLYLLDEPANHLDLYYQTLILNYFKNLAQQQAITIVMVLQDLNQASRYCSHAMLLLEGGKLLAGPIAEMLQETHLTNVYQQALLKFNTPHGDFWVAQ